MRKILKEQIKIKDHLSPAEAETGTELGNKLFNHKLYSVLIILHVAHVIVRLLWYCAN